METNSKTKLDVDLTEGLSRRNADQGETRVAIYYLVHTRSRLALRFHIVCEDRRGL